jgi:hypothetical protein
MTADRIREALTAKPFVPFDLRLVDGRSFTITHTDYLAVPPVPRPRDIIVFTPKPDDPGEYRTHWINLGLILELTTPSEAAAAPEKPPAGGDA